jgi:Ca2+-binding RTX toxin-like protein
MDRRRQGWLAAGVAALSLAAFAPAAGAATATVSADGTELRFEAAAGELNRLTLNGPGVGEPGYSFVETGAGVTITPGNGCTADSPTRVVCAPAGLERIVISLGDGDDTLYLYSALIPVTVNGDAGNDLLEDPEIGPVTSTRTFDGGEGDDYLTAKSDGGPVRLAHDYVGGSGTDIAAYADRSVGQTISIDDVANDGETGEGDNVHTDIEHVLGSSAADTIVGSAANDFLVGNGGADTLQGAGGDDKLKASAGCDADQLDGGAGADILFLGGNTTAQGGLDNDDLVAAEADCPTGHDTASGGDGTDQASFANVAATLTVSLTGGAPNDGFGGADDFQGDIENIRAGSGGMTLIGNDGANELIGGAGNDVLDGRAGKDQLRGGDGIDLADYSSRTVAVSLSNDGLGNDGDATDGGDGIWADVENLRGGSGDDTLTGNAAANVLDGGPGADSISGGAGVDAVDYSTRTAPVNVTLGAGSRDDGEAGEEDTVAGDVEGAFGGSGADTLVGGAGDGFLVGGAGNDSLSDNGGVDSLDGGAGDDKIDSDDGFADTVSCGAGADDVTSDALDTVAADCAPDVPPVDPPVDPPTNPGPPNNPSPPVTPAVPGTPVTPIDTTAPKAKLSSAKGWGLGKLRSGGLKLTVTSSEPGKVTATLTAESSTLKALKRRGVSAKTALGRGSASSGKALRLRLTKSGRKALRGLAVAKLKLVVKVSDAAGNAVTVTRHVKLR